MRPPIPALGTPRASTGPLWCIIALTLGCASPVSSSEGVILISLDTLRADHLGVYGGSNGLTPNLDRFAAESVVFDQTYAAANETLYSHAALFTGQAPSRLSSLSRHFAIPTEAPTLAGVLTAAGWDTAGFVAGGHLSRYFGLNAGFSTWDDASAWGSLHDTGPKALAWLDARDSKNGRPFFIFVHGYDTHDRYLKPTPFGYAFTAPEPDVGQSLGSLIARTAGAAGHVIDGVYSPSIDDEALLGLEHPRFDRGRGIRTLDPDAKPLSPADIVQLNAVYDGSVAWADACFGLFMAGLDARGLLDRVTVIVLSDHGEELGEAGVFQHRYSLDDATTHVPLMVRLPGGAHGGRRLTGLTSLVDVAPAILDLQGYQGLGDAGHPVRDAILGRDYPGRSSVISEGALHLLSARGPHARLTLEGVSAENPLAASLLAAIPVDGVSLRAEGDPEEIPALRRDLVAFRTPGGPR